MIRKKQVYASLIVAGAALSSTAAFAACPAGYPTHAQLVTALQAAQSASNGGFGLHMWASIVARNGIVCDVAYSGGTVGDQWPGSRVISAQKANTANAFSLPGFALSTANLYTATQPGGSLFGLQESNPVNTAVAYGGVFAEYGTATDGMLGKRIGGVNVFGGGLPLYNARGTLIGGVGVSGDSSCADHNIAWRVRHSLGLDHVPGGVSANSDDNIIYDISYGTAGIAAIPGLGKSASGWGHPACTAAATSIAKAFKKAGSTLPTAAP